MGRHLVRMTPLNGPKYHNIATMGPTPDGLQREYPSAKQARYAVELRARQLARDIRAWEPEVSIRLAVGGKPLRPFNGKRDCFYRADFIITHLDGSIECHDTKGYANSKSPATGIWQLKLAILQLMYPDWLITVG